VVTACFLGPALLTAQKPPRIEPDSLRQSVISSMKDGLKEMVKAQNLYFSRHKAFAANLKSSTPPPKPLPYQLHIVAADAGGWSAVTTAAGEPALHCGIYVGSGVAPNAAVVASAVPACWSVVGDGSMVTE
jgi:hypothetical protein